MDIMDIKEILEQAKIIAVVGFSDNHSRPSNRIGRYLHGNNYKVYGVNPRLHNKDVDEINCYAHLKYLPEEPDLINIFRRSEFVEELMIEILKLHRKPKTVWTQIGVISNEAKKMALANEIKYIENKCIMVEHTKLNF
jgi:uncharacterized protein